MKIYKRESSFSAPSTRGRWNWIRLSVTDSRECFSEFSSPTTTHSHSIDLWVATHVSFFRYVHLVRSMRARRMYRYAIDLSCTLQFTSLSRAGFPRGLSTSATINWNMPFRLSNPLLIMLRLAAHLFYATMTTRCGDNIRMSDGYDLRMTRMNADQSCSNNCLNGTHTVRLHFTLANCYKRQTFLLLRHSHKCYSFTTVNLRDSVLQTFSKIHLELGWPSSSPMEI